jgi:hypothetical protein
MDGIPPVSLPSSLCDACATRDAAGQRLQLIDNDEPISGVNEKRPQPIAFEAVEADKE